MNLTLPIGDFSWATHLSVKMLRHYHEIRLLEPVDVDVDTGYRRYAAEQIVTAQIIRRFRDLDMPLEDIQIVLQAPDVETRNRVIANHLARLESSLARTHEAVTSLRELLDHPQASLPIDHRHLASTPAAVITDIVDKADALAWYRGAIGELAATLSAQGINPAGPAGGIFATELFTEDRGRATIFLPCDPVPRPIGRVSATVIPPAELATIVHPGPHTHIDRTWVRRSSDHCTKTTQRLPSPNCSRSWPAATKSHPSEPSSIPPSVFTPPPAVSASLLATKNNSRPGRNGYSPCVARCRATGPGATSPSDEFS